MGKDVVILLDSITSTARAYKFVRSRQVVERFPEVWSGRFVAAKKFFRRRQELQEGGSLTIIGTALVRYRFKNGRFNLRRI